MKLYQHKEITVIRPAKADDKGYDRAKGSQLLIRLADGTEKVVPESEVTTDGASDTAQSQTKPGAA